MGAGGIFTVLILGLVGFILFCIYFILKQLEFVLVSVNLYKKMVHRQDAMVNLLLDIRDQSKKYNQSSISSDLREDSEEIEDLNSDPEEECSPLEIVDVYSDPEQEYSPFCYHCGAELAEDSAQCSSCGKKL